MRTFRSDVAAALLMVVAVLAGPLLRAESRPEREFHLPAGPTEVSLREFVRVSGENLLFPARLLEGATSAAVEGRMSPDEALHRLLTGTGVEAVRAGNMLTLKKTPADVVTLPAFLVRGDRDWGWWYGEFPGMTVLSACDERVTREFIHRLLQDEADFDQLVPSRFQGHEPEILILVPPVRAAALESEMAKILRQRAGSLRTVPHLRIAEPGSSATYFIVDPADHVSLHGTNRLLEWLGKLYDADDDYLHFTLAPEFIWYRLQTGPARLPPWLVSGIADLYSRSGDTATGLYAAPIPADEWARAFGGGPAAGLLPPLGVLLAGPPFPQGDIGYRRRLRLEAELLVRWALNSGGGRRHGPWRILPAMEQEPGGLGKLADAAAHGPLNDAAFRTVFGVGLAEAQAELPAVATASRASSLRWGERGTSVRPLRFAAATTDQIDWAMLEWDRRVLVTVRKERPQLAAAYEEQARAVLARADRYQAPSGRLQVARDRLRHDLAVEMIGLKPVVPALVISGNPLGLPRMTSGTVAPDYPVTITAATSRHYQRRRAAGGSIRPETFVFGEGPHQQAQRIDSTAEHVTYADVCRALLDPLRIQGYVPAAKAEDAELLLVILWGTTANPENQNAEALQGSLDRAETAADPAQWRGGSSEGAGIALAQQVADLQVQVGLMQSLAERVEARNAALLGYDRAARQKYAEELQHERYYVAVVAFDHRKWRQGRREIVWETRYSIDDHHAFDEELAAMTRRASRYFGANSGGTVHDDVPAGHVEVGTPRPVPDSIPPGK